jgi:mono/diheme cytochrome c family protein
VGPFALAAAAAILVTAAASAPAAESGGDRAAAAVKGKQLVDRYCVECHSGEWQDETYESIVGLLRGMYVGKVKHRFKIKRLNEEEIHQVAAYWTPKPGAKQKKATTSIE